MKLSRLSDAAEENECLIHAVQFPDPHNNKFTEEEVRYPVSAGTLTTVGSPLSEIF